MDPLLAVPSFQQMARNTGQTPEQYLASLDEGDLNVHRQILLGAERKPASVAPVLESATAPPTVKPQIPILTPVAEPYVEPVAVPDPALANTGIPDGFKVVDYPVGPKGTHTVLFNAATGETRPHSESSNQFFGTPTAERKTQEITRQAYGQSEFNVPLDMAKIDARQADGALTTAMTGENLDAAVLANQNVNSLATAAETYNPAELIPGATSGSLNTFTDVPHGLDDLATENPALPTTQQSSVQTPSPANGPYLARPVLDDEMSNSTVETLNPTYGPHTASPSLVDTTTPTNTTKTDPVIQTGQNGTTSRTPILSRGGKSMTGNARGSNRPQAYQTPKGESLIRIGGAMYSGALQGDGLGAATREYGSIQDANRATQERVDQAAEATRLAELRAKATGSKAGSAAATKASAANQKALDIVNDSLWGMQNGLDAIEASRAAGGNLTGIGGIFKGLFDRFTGDPDANRRLTLERLRVNDALLRTAETKGAISNSEMSLFLKPAPINLEDEQVWVDWINLRMEALGRVQTRLQGGVVLGPGERANNFGTYGSEGEFKFTPEMQAAFDKYKQ